MSAQPGGFLPPLDPSGQGSDTKRLLLTVVIVTAMWLGFQGLFPKTAPATPAMPAATAVAVQPAASSAPDTIQNATLDTMPETTTAVSVNVAQATGADAVAVKGGYDAVVTSHGGQLASFALNGYADHKNVGHPIDLVAPAHDGARFLALRSRGGDVELKADAAYEQTKDGFERLTASGVRITRGYKFDDKKFAFVHEITLKNEGTQQRTATFDVVISGQERAGERNEGGMMAPPTDALAGACKVGDKRSAFKSRDVEKKPPSFDGAVQYVALDRHYFLGAVLFSGVATERCGAKPFTVAGPDKDGKSSTVQGFDLVVEQSPIVLAAGEVKTLTYPVYAGPKQVGLLQAFGNGIDENIDFGWFGVIARPMLWILVRFHGMTGNFGVAIILLTLLMKALTFPLTQKSYVSMQQMKVVTPQIKELQKKYGHDKALLGQKQMDLYKESGINPMAGCLPMLVQMPIWFALYRTLSQAVELYQQPFAFGIFDLTQPDYLLPFGISFLPLIVGGLMLVQTWMQPPPDDQPQMKYVMWFMPIMFTFLMLQMASGLSIYMITNSLLTMGQQWFVKKRYAASAANSSSVKTDAGRAGK